MKADRSHRSPSSAGVPPTPSGGPEGGATKTLFHHHCAGQVCDPRDVAL
jgi:hypothetical protein